MKINWKVRFKNKTWLLAFIGVIVAFIYQILGLFGVVPAVTEDYIIQLATLIINGLVAIGVLQDPTTEGISDSQKALTYDRPADNCKK